MNARKVCLLGLLMMMVSTVLVVAQDSGARTWFGLEPGPYKVGYRNVLTEDPGRGFHQLTGFRGDPIKGPHVRPLAISIWYPASEIGSGKPLSLFDYAQIAAAKFKYDMEDKHASNPLKSFLDHEGIDINNAEDIAKLKQLHGRAYRDATPAKGRFPIFLYAPSYDAPAIENSQLCEYLASHGFVVLSAPSIGASDRSMTLDVIGIEMQVQDMQFLMRYAADMDNADMSKITAGGYSWGGLAAPLLAMRDPRIKAVVAMDGSLDSNLIGFDDYGFLDSRAIRAPFYQMLSGGMPDLVPTFLYCDRTTIEYRGIGHQHFSGFWISDVYEQENPEHNQAVYRDVCKSVQTFLSAVLVSKSEFAKFKAERQAYAASDKANYRNQEPLHTPPTDAEFLAVLDDDGVKAAQKLYAACKSRDPEIRISNQMDVEAVARTKSFDERLGILDFVKETFGENSSYFNNMGAAFISAGDDENAEKWFRKALEANPNSGYAKRSLAQIEERKNQKVKK